MSLSIDDFTAFMQEVYGYVPFPWQTRLCARVLAVGWPRVLQLPTAAGKTATMDIAVFALAAGAPAARRRVAFVVDRRVVVDEASRRARHLAGVLARAQNGVAERVASRLRDLGGTESPLVTATLRGGILRDDNWARSPAQPVLVCSTVDQVGSRLLFRGYGCRSPRAWPIHAGLLGCDAMLIIDEAHCAQPFCETAVAVADRYARWAETPVGLPLTVLRMSATLGEDADFSLDDADRTTPALAARLTASKPATLHLATPGRAQPPREAVAAAVVEQAMALAQQAPRVVGIVVNRVATARQVFCHLPVPDNRKLLLTGRVRPLERDRLLAEWEPRITAAAGRPSAAESIFVVSTQCIEVGANLDFDALVSECAPLDALRQRFGRLNRLGTQPSAPAVVVGEAAAVDASGKPDPIYGPALARTWEWLSAMAAGGRGDGHVDFGIEAMDAVLPGDDLADVCSPTSHAPVLLPTHLDLLAQTSPEPTPSPEIGLYLHGPKTGADDVTVVWRADLADDQPDAWADLVAVLPPVTGEGCPVPFVAARAWLLAGPVAPAADGDVAGLDVEETGSDGRGRAALRWRGIDDAVVVGAHDLRPGDTIVVPSGYGGCDAFGWDTTSTTPVVDIGDEAAWRAGRRPLLRLSAGVTAGWLPTGVPDEFAPRVREAVGQLRGWVAGDEDVDAQAGLQVLATAPDVPVWVRDVATALKQDRRLGVLTIRDAPVLVSRSRGRPGTLDEPDVGISSSDDTSLLTVPVSLRRHQAGVAAWARRSADACGVGGARAVDLVAAARWHDLGKADPRFQVLLTGGDEVAAALLDEPLAKSGLRPLDRPAFRRARERAGYPPGGRHEFLSAALLAHTPDALKDVADAELVLHLISSHHGYGRPLAPVALDPDPISVDVTDEGLTFRASSDHQAYRLDSGVTDRFWRMQRRYGWWGLAWLEALLRLADHRRSEEEEQEGEPCV